MIYKESVVTYFRIQLTSDETTLPYIIIRYKGQKSTYDTPATPISKQISNYTVTGLWWGGIISDIYIAGGVGSATIAKTNNTQSQASVTYGYAGCYEAPLLGPGQECVKSLFIGGRDIDIRDILIKHA